MADFINVVNSAADRWIKSPPGSPHRLAASAELAVCKHLGLWVVGPMSGVDTHSRNFRGLIDQAVASIQPLIANDDSSQFPPPPNKDALILDNLENIQRAISVQTSLWQTLANDVRRLTATEARKTIHEVARKFA